MQYEIACDRKFSIKIESLPGFLINKFYKIIFFID